MEMIRFFGYFKLDNQLTTFLSALLTNLAAFVPPRGESQTAGERAAMCLAGQKYHQLNYLADQTLADTSIETQTLKLGSKHLHRDSSGYAVWNLAQQVYNMCDMNRPS